MKRHAVSLAQQMTDAGITPQNVANHPAHSVSKVRVDGVITDVPYLSYAENDSGGVTLGLQACTLHKQGDDWLLWDDYGAYCYRISYNGTRWVAGDKKEG